MWSLNSTGEEGDGLQKEWLSRSKPKTPPILKATVEYLTSCASSNRLLLTAVSANTTLLYLKDTKNFTTSGLSDIPLFDQSSNYPVRVSSRNGLTHHQCLTKITLARPTCVIPPLLLWCQRNAQPYVNLSLPTCCVPVMSTPQVYLFKEKEAALLLQTRLQRERYLHPSSGGNRTHPLPGRWEHCNCHGCTDPSSSRRLSESTGPAHSINYCKPGVTTKTERSCWSSSPQSKKPPSETAQQGGTCMVLGEECSFFVSDSNLMEQNVKILKALCKDLLTWYNPKELLSWF